MLCVPRLKRSNIVFFSVLACALFGTILRLIYLVFLTLLFLLTLLPSSFLSRLRPRPHSFSLYCYLIATVLFWTWQTRNLATFRNSVLNSTQIVNLIKKDVIRRILCAKHDEQDNLWSTGNILCKISDNRSLSFFPYCI